ncbi:MAG: hypothetical protein U1E76_08085 [Planctomycetota bacterium]
MMAKCHISAPSLPEYTHTSPMSTNTSGTPSWFTSPGPATARPKPTPPVHSRSLLPSLPEYTRT